MGPRPKAKARVVVFEPDGDPPFGGWFVEMGGWVRKPPHANDIKCNDINNQY